MKTESKQVKNKTTKTPVKKPEKKTVDFFADKEVSSLQEFSKVFSELLKVKTGLDFVLNISGVDVPTNISDYYLSESMFGDYFSLSCYYNFVDMIDLYESKIIYASAFSDKIDKNITVKRTVRDVLRSIGIRILSIEEKDRLTKELQECYELSQETGKVYEIHDHLYVARSGYFFELKKYDIHSPVSVIPEFKLDVDDLSFTNLYLKGIQVPYIRVFSLYHKAYTYVKVSQLKEHKWDSTGVDKISLPEDTKSVLNSVFSGKETFGDMFNDRHGGMIILANGTPGTGKTLTAEVYSEKIKKPLYVLEVGEIGVNLVSVEDNLKMIFERAQRWDAVLLFDEADIFLTKRSEEDLERSAIVGIFLRLLDKYQGILFLTTNRAEVIDDAFKSRVTLKIQYNDLTNEDRLFIWSNMLKKAGFKISDKDLKKISSEKINGRQIRNHTRLLSKLFDKDTLTAKEIIPTFKFLSR